MWHEIVKNKYNIENGYRIHASIDNSACRVGLLKLKQIYAKVRMVMVGSGQQTGIWGSIWCGGRPLKQQFPILF